MNAPIFKELITSTVMNLTKNLLSKFQSVTLADLEKVSLLNRIDSKYVFHVNDLAGVLEELKENYNVLEISGKRIHRYETQYFDTDNYDLYKQHHNGIPNRMKVRFRHYVDTNQIFFEVKYKEKGIRTNKVRLIRNTIPQNLDQEELKMIVAKHIDSGSLKPKLGVFFDRITLTRKDFSERATLDIGLTYEQNEEKFVYDDIVIAEIKQNKTSYNSPIVKALKSRHMVETGFSKYSMGIAATQQIKSNRFKPNFIKIEKLRNGQHD
jgi:hypothetical protein